MPWQTVHLAQKDYMELLQRREIRVLIADDDEEDAFIIRDLLKEIPVTRYKIEVVSTANDTISRLCSNQDDVCLLDYFLVETSGRELLDELARRDCRVPVIILTGRGSLEVDWLSMESGAMDYLEKGSVTPGILERSIRYAITHRKTVENLLEAQERERSKAHELERTVSELQRSNQELEQFAYVVSHDLQEPLRQVVGFSGLIKHKSQNKLDESAQELLDYIIDGGKRMGKLINDLLAYSRVGRVDVSKERTDLQNALASALQNLQAAIQESGATVTHDPMPTLTVNATQITQVFQNLIGNAIKFRSDQPPHIHICAHLRRDKWLFSVKDNGIGFRNEDAETIFNIFQRLHPRDRYEGSGIGLAICRKIIEQHGGKVYAESTPGHGATFYFTLPDE